MSKNIVICSDGTGNNGGKTRGTNVWRIFNAVDRHRDALEQITFYDDGVGTDKLRWRHVLGGAFGCGLSRNLRQLYAFIVMHYEPGDKLFLFGFSRGAYTVRSLAAMICRCGLLERRAFLNLSPAERERALKRILKAYRSAKALLEPREGEADEDQVQRNRRALKLDDLKFRDTRILIHFIGVWDTVDAVGLPFDDFKVIDRIWEKFFGRRLWGFHDRTLDLQVQHACQALALDDVFHPNIWAPRHGIEQVWFVGVHSNVGGGYPKDSLSLISLDWMMGKAEERDLVFLRGKREEHRSAADAHGRLYDSRAGTGAFYRYAARNLYERSADPHVHASVFERIARGTDRYAPKVLRESCEIAWTNQCRCRRTTVCSGPRRGSRPSLLSPVSWCSSSVTCSSLKTWSSASPPTGTRATACAVSAGSPPASRSW